MIIRRRRFIQPAALEDRLAAEAKSFRLEAAALPPGLQREALLRKARQREVAADTTAWLSSPELQIGARVRLPNWVNLARQGYEFTRAAS